MTKAVDRKRVAVLVSGRGSNMQALVAAAQAADYPAEIVAVIANRPDSAGLDWAADQGIVSVGLDHRAFSDRAAFDARLDEVLTRLGVDIVALAGFMRLLTPDFVDRWRGRLINIHPSLLPLFPGLDTHARALEAGVRIAGCTVHFVTAEMDAGPIIVQAAVPVEADDTADTLAARVLVAEHLIYPEALKWVADGAVTFDNAGLERAGPPRDAAMLISPAPN